MGTLPSAGYYMKHLERLNAQLYRFRAQIKHLRAAMETTRTEIDKLLMQIEKEKTWTENKEKN